MTGATQSWYRKGATWGLLLLMAVAGSACNTTTPAPVRVAAGPPLALNLEPDELTIRRAAGKIYTVRPGDTLWAIAMVHDVELEDMAHWNRIDNPDVITVGQKLVVKGKPGGGYVAVNKVKEAPSPQRVKGTSPGETEATEENGAAEEAPVLQKPEVTSQDGETSSSPPDMPPLAQSQEDAPLPEVAPERRRESDTPDAQVPPLRREEERENPAPAAATTQAKPPRPAKNTWVIQAGAPQKWHWPASNKQVLSRFGTTSAGRPSTGIDIAGNRGDPVFAAADGVVAYADNGLPGYGNLLIVRHGGSFMTAYAHNAELLVQRGETVRAGQTIAKVGNSGRVTSPRLHFELRRGINPINPLNYLPH